MKYNTGVFDAIFGEKMTVQIRQDNGTMKDVVVTKAWWEKMQAEGVFRVVPASQSVTAHILDPKTGYTQETWIAGTHIKHEDVEKWSENGNVFVLGYYDKGIPKSMICSRAIWNDTKANYDQTDRDSQERMRRINDEFNKLG